MRLRSDEEPFTPLQPGYQVKLIEWARIISVMIYASRHIFPFSIQYVSFLTFHRPSPEILSKARLESKQGL